MKAKYFSYDPEGNGFSIHLTAAEAAKSAKEALAASLDETWSEEVEDICWGEVRQGVEEVSRRPVDPEEDGNPPYDEIVDYQLRPEEPQPTAEEELASLRELAEIGRAAVRVRVVLDAGPWSDAAQTVESDLDNAVSTYLAAHPEAAQ